MKKMILRGYGIIAMLLLFMLLYGLLNLRLTIYRKTAPTGYGEIVDYERMTEKDAAAPLGEKTVISFTLKNVRSDYNSLLFLTAHQEVAVYLDSEEVYHLKAIPGVGVPKSPGVAYNEVVFGNEDNGKKVRIELMPVYRGINDVPDLMLGNGFQIILVILLTNLPILLLCTAVILIGILQILMAAINQKQEERLDVAISHSAFTILIGIWKMLDSDFVGLFGRSLPVLSVIPFVILMLLPYMMAKFVRDAMGANKTVIWQIPEVAMFAGMAVSLGMQFLGIQDFRESLWITEIALAVTMICVILGIIIYVKKHGWDKNAKAGCACAALSTIWMVVDLYTYFFTSGVTSFPISMLLYLTFLLWMIGNRLRISKRGMEVGMQARHYKKLAYHDALTGFFNRAAYVDYLASSEFNPKKSVLVAFDLNNLKKCNDELGHDKGDVYLKESAKIIMDCFGEGGRCYRLGGDEFGAILMTDDLRECAKRVKKMYARVERFNQESNDIHMGIACGYAIYDPEEDGDVHATIRRADKMMYEEKFRMKHQMRA